MRKLVKLLREQIRELEKTLELKDLRIAELEKFRSTQVVLQPAYPTTVINTPFVAPVPCDHEYPTPWFGTTPAPCKKCGYQPNPYVVTCNLVKMDDRTSGIINRKD